VNLSVAVRAGETYLHVEGGLPVGTYPRLAIYSSDVIVPNIALDSPLWDPGVAWSVRDRMRNRGNEKGRAIALWHRALGSEPTPFAVLTWHTEGAGPFYVFAVGTRNNLNAPLRRQLEAALLAVLLTASKHREAPVAPEWQDTLRWATVHFLHAPHGDRKEYATAAIRHAKRLGFDRHQPPPAAPAAMSESWLGERNFRPQGQVG
jgi:hypothetical protein